MSKKIRRRPGCGIGGAPDRKVAWNNLLYAVDGETIGRARSPDRAGAVRKQKIRFVAARHPSKMAPIRGRNDSQIFLGHLAQSSGMVKTIPYRTFYCVPPPHKHPVGWGHPTPPETYRSRYKKTCDVLCPTVGEGVLDVPDGHINDCTFAGNLPPQKIARTT